MASNDSCGDGFPRAKGVEDSTSAAQANMPPRNRGHSLGQNRSPGSVIVKVPTETTAQSETASPSSNGDSPQLPSLSPDTVDRVFPIRSVISVNPTPSGLQSLPSEDVMDEPSASLSTTRRPSLTGFVSDTDIKPVQNSPSDGQGEPRHFDETLIHSERGSKTQYLSPQRAALQTTGEDAGSGRISTDGISMTSSTDGGVPLDGQDIPPSVGKEAPQLFTTRYKHVMTEDGHAVLTGRDGDELQRCEDEKIHIPGAVQGFGVLVALHEETEGKLVVRVVSENSKRILGYSPKELFELESFGDILSEEQEDNLLDHVDFVRDEGCDPKVQGPEVFILSIRLPDGEERKFWCAIHMNDVNKDYIICEFELEDDQINPLNVNGETTPDEPLDTLGATPTADELAQSTVSASLPLRMLRSARSKRGEAAAMKVFNMLSQVQEQLANAPTLDALLNILAGIVKELTGFHRVMVYQFDSSWNGLVVAEMVDPKASTDLYKGLRFPASDIPKQARDLYRVNKVRLLYDRDQETARLVCRSLKDLEEPLDMTYTYLRAMSPIHVKYLANMGTRSSMSISINAFDELWGLISCHSYGRSGMRVSFPIRKMCRLIGDTTSRNIERLSYASRLQARKLINTVPTEANPSGYIVASSDDLLRLFEADFGALSIRDETKILGRVVQAQEVLVMLEYLRVRRITSVLASHDIAKDFPDLSYPPGFKNISGLLYVPLSSGGSDFIVFFRRGQLTEVKWAGNPYEKKYREGTAAYLEPRASFKTWKETIMTRSREWSEADVETAAVLCLVYGKFIEVWRQKEAVMQSTQLTKLLLANSAHEVRTPLNAIVNYLEIALEGSLDGEIRENLAKSHSASKSLIYVINDLLDLTNTENGQNLIKDEVFDLHTTLKEAAEMFEGEAKRKNIAYNVIEYPGVPKSVLGDQRRVRQVITNIISNAMQHTSSGAITVEIWPSPTQQEPGHMDVEVAVNDTGSGMSHDTLENLFRELEQVSSEHDPVYYEHYNIRESGENLDDEQKPVLGLGLALVARIVRNMQGQLSVKSEEGKGSRFKILLRFPLPADEEKPVTREVLLQAEEHDVPQTPPPIDGEFLLINRSSHSRCGSRRRNSNSSSLSGNSSRSGKSDVDRLISAIQDGPFTQKPAHESLHARRKRRDGSRDGGNNPSITSDPAHAAKTPIASPLSTQGNKPSPVSSPTTSGRMAMPLCSPRLPGQESVTDSGVPLSALRVQEDNTSQSSSTGPPSSIGDAKSPKPAIDLNIRGYEKDVNVSSKSDPTVAESGLRVLVAEDDPVNSKIIQKRLEKAGHTVHLTVNGEECAIAHRENPNAFDVVLMDIQMPIVDGVTSTKMIREFERKVPGPRLSVVAPHNTRIPIFAVSASLLEKDRQMYIDSGFDGWILKPIDFKRINNLLDGVLKDEVRDTCLYEPGLWEKGGWFVKHN
ncbi:sensor histidine kinase/response regulator, putative [Paecilomyces variotii No. 5]|uniref:Sensor histidine kinase/response regulator, putative n=1 Tax=Byssochlamys spectabilis (strain No. 5 / NBRC 109023) TaxID=1356009 RepID=V5FZI8_BYSSN|nr:sensor histidine kinase/response regulator, putative [Paecilomyces variotii No. 5]